MLKHKLRWTNVLPVVLFMYISAFIDRNNISMAAPSIAHSFQLSAGQMGLLMSAFFVGYVILQWPGGYLAQVYSARRFIFWALLSWGFFSFLSGLAPNFGWLLVDRFLLGLSEGGVWPAALVLVGNWFPKDERARANALWMLALPAANILMGPFSGWLIQDYGWRFMFEAQAVLPIVIALAFRFFIHDHPHNEERLSSQERHYILTSLAVERAEKVQNVSIWTAIRNREVLILSVMYFFWITGFYGFGLWLPTVLQKATHLSIITIGFVSTFPYIVALIAMIVNSVWSDRLGTRKPFMVVPFILGALGIVIGELTHGNLWLVLLSMGVAGIGFYAPFGPMWAFPADILPKSVSGPAMGFISMVGVTGGIVGPWAVGELTAITGHFTIGFLFLGACLGVAAILAGLLREEKVPVTALVATLDEQKKA